jgi:hypothetical protein
MMSRNSVAHALRNGMPVAHRKAGYRGWKRMAWVGIAIAVAGLGARGLVRVFVSPSATFAIDGSDPTDSTALQTAVVSEEDLYPDAEGRRPIDLRTIPGLRARRQPPPEVQSRIDTLRARRAAIAAGQKIDFPPVVFPELPAGHGAPPRMDSGASHPDRVVTTLALPAAR